MDMQLSFDASAGWATLARKNVDVLLLVSIGSLGLLPLVSIYIIETEKYDDHAQSLFKLQSTPEFLRYCIRCMVYIAILFPYFLALLSTYVSMQLIRGQSILNQESRSGLRADALKRENDRKHKILQQCLAKYQKILKPADFALEKCNSKSTQSTGSKTPANIRPFSLGDDCAICMYPFEDQDAVIASSNPKCIHRFHAACLYSWMRPCKTQNEHCPCCRQVFFHELENATTT